jgi:putative transposase
LVARTDDYPWSSYQERINGNEKEMLDDDVCYQSLANTNEARRLKYKIFLDNGISESERKLIKNAVGRNQITGNRRFVDEIEMRIGLPIEQPGRGRPSNEIKLNYP